jgi:hypothetical protein
MLHANRVIIFMYTLGRLQRNAGGPSADRHSSANSHRYIQPLTDEYAHAHRNPDRDPGTHSHFRTVANS